MLKALMSSYTASKDPTELATDKQTNKNRFLEMLSALLGI